MQFKPFTDEEFEFDLRFEPGEYEFFITEVIEKCSQNGNDMFLLFISLRDQNGKTMEIRDHIVSTVRWRMSQLAKALGNDIKIKLKQGTLTSYDLKNRKGHCITVNETTEKGTFLKIKEYKAINPNEIIDDSIPF